MEMIICPACHKKTPAEINKCIRCDQKITTQKVDQKKVQSSVVTIETTSKKIKGQLLASIALLCLGVAVSISGQPAIGIVLTIAGLIWYIVTRFSAWWNHG